MVVHARYKRAGSWKYIRVGTLGNGATLRASGEEEPLKDKKKWCPERKEEKQKDWGSQEQEFKKVNVASRLDAANWKWSQEQAKHGDSLGVDHSV